MKIPLSDIQLERTDLVNIVAAGIIALVQERIRSAIDPSFVLDESYLPSMLAEADHQLAQFEKAVIEKDKAESTDD